MDEFDDLSGISSLDLINSLEEPSQEPELHEEDFLESLLKSRGIEDSSKIKFENEDGTIEDRNWNDLNNSEKLNIINSNTVDPDTDLDDSEIELINTIRSSKMSPKEYLNYVVNSSMPEYPTEPQYSIDQYSDDELYVMDLLTKMPDITDDEAREMLERAKSNESLYSKLIGAIRRDYQALEDEMYRQALFEEQAQALAQYQQFSDSVVDSINNFTEYANYELNMDLEDMQTLYDFITGTDAAGVNHFAKALSDPATLVRTAYLALNGKQMIEDISTYFKNEIASVSKASYEKGLRDAKTNVVYKEPTKSQDPIWDLDDF